MSNWTNLEELKVKELLAKGWGPSKIAGYAADRMGKSFHAVRGKAIRLQKDAGAREEKQAAEIMAARSGVTLKTIIDAPPVYLEPQRGDTKRTAVVCFSDIHYGALVTDPLTGSVVYNEDTAKKRMETTLKEALAFGTTHLTILMLGDILDGDRIYRTHHAHVQSQVLDQVMAFSEWFVGVIKGLAEKLAVDIYCVPGNHGRVAKDSAEVNNWDTVCYKIVALCLSESGVKNVGISVFKSGVGVVDVLGHRGFLKHIMVNHAGTAAKRDKIGSWAKRYDTTWFACGHFHTPGVLDYEGYPIFSNGSTVEPSLLCDKLAKYATPAQIVFTATPKELPEVTKIVKFKE